MKQLCLLSPWTLDCELWYFKVSLWFWQILGQALCSFTQKVAKSLWNLVWGEYFHILMNFSNVPTVFIAEWRVHVYVSSTFPHSEQLDFIWRSVSCSICCVSHWVFFPWKAVQHLGMSWQTICIWVFDYMPLRFVSWKGQCPGPGTGTGQGSSKRLRPFPVPVRDVLHTLLYWRSLFYLFLFLFILVEWNLIFIVWNSCLLTTSCEHLNFFFKWQKKEKTLSDW